MNDYQTAALFLKNKIEQRKKRLLLRDVTPSFSDKVPSQWQSDYISSNVLDGGSGILLADLSRVKRVLQIPVSKINFTDRFLSSAEKQITLLL